MNGSGRTIGVLGAIIILAAGCGGTSLPGISTPDTTPAPRPRVAIPAKIECGPLEPFFGYREPPAPGGPMGLLLAMAYDARAGQLVSVWDDEQFRQTWTFDVCTNAWQLMDEWDHGAGIRAGDPAPTPPDVRSLVFDADSDVSVGIDVDARVWSFDSKFGEWTDLGLARSKGPTRLAYDQTTGLIVAIELSMGQSADFRPTLWAYDVDGNTWRELPQVDPPLLGRDADHLLVAYDTSVDGIVADQLGRTWTLDPRAGSWSAWPGESPYVPTGYVASGGEMAYDEARKQAVAFGAGQVIGYRAPYRMTTVLYDSPHDADGVGGGPLARMMHWLAYDPIHARFIVTGGAFQTPDALEGMRPGNDVWAWDPPTSEWQQLAMAATERTNFEPPYAPED